MQRCSPSLVWEPRAMLKKRWTAVAFPSRPRSRKHPGDAEMSIKTSAHTHARTLAHRHTPRCLGLSWTLCRWFQPLRSGLPGRCARTDLSLELKPWCRLPTPVTSLSVCRCLEGKKKSVCIKKNHPANGSIFKIPSPMRRFWL